MTAAHPNQAGHHSEHCHLSRLHKSAKGGALGAALEECDGGPIQERCKRGSNTTESVFN
jgi:hypothetical protein